jgi:SAM-dependent methyltransferase
MTEISEHTRTYWEYEYQVSSRFMASLLRQWGVALAGATVLDVGCAEGGGLCALHDAGAQCAGFDIDELRVDAAHALQGDRAIDFRTGNMYTDGTPFTGKQFDLVVLHDVFEHLDQKQAMMAKLGTYMKPDGRLLITFPPYYSAYGAHQQHLRAPLARLPFAHLLPFGISAILPRLRNESPAIVTEVQKLGRLKMGMRKFEAIASAGGMRVVGKKAYLISPNHIRFGLRPLPAGPVAHLPFVAELVCSGVVYLLAKA